MPTQITGTGGVDKVVDGPISQSDLATAVIPIGVNQTWQTVTRVAGTTYTNNNGRPITLAVTFAASATAGTFTLTVGGVLVLSGSTAANIAVNQSVSAVIPTGATYVVAVTGGTTIATTAELK